LGGGVPKSDYDRLVERATGFNTKKTECNVNLRDLQAKCRGVDQMKSAHEKLKADFAIAVTSLQNANGAINYPREWDMWLRAYKKEHFDEKLWWLHPLDTWDAASRGWKRGMENKERAKRERAQGFTE